MGKIYASFNQNSQKPAKKMPLAFLVKLASNGDETLLHIKRRRKKTK